MNEYKESRVKETKTKTNGEINFFTERQLKELT